ncbi:MAG: acyl-CoA dehydrogenase, partial [Desulfobacterales bacterium]|nr:acyl-CoA dehydrogenase [Desulfobacterales bacterium]
MSYQLTEEQRMIQAMVRDFAREVVLPGAAERDLTGEFPRENLKKMGELGLMGMSVPPAYNGSGADTISYSLAMQEIAYACASTAVVMSVHNSVCCGPVYLFGSDYLKETYLKPLAAGEKIGSFALTEPGAGSDPAGQKTKAFKDGDTYVINGTKTFITSGKNSDITVVTAYTDKDKKHKGISAFLLEKGTPGFHVGKKEDKMGLRSSDTVELIFEDCRVPAKNLLGREGDGFIIAMASLDSGRIGIASQSVGLAQACLDAAVSYSKERVQFNKTISK